VRIKIVTYRNDMISIMKMKWEKSDAICL